MLLSGTNPEGHAAISAMSVADAEQDGLAGLAVQESGFPALSLFASKGPPRLRVGLDEEKYDTLSIITLNDQAGVRRFVLSAGGTYPEGAMLGVVADNQAVIEIVR